MCQYNRTSKFLQTCIGIPRTLTQTSAKNKALEKTISFKHIHNHAELAAPSPRGGLVDPRMRASNEIKMILPSLLVSLLGSCLVWFPTAHVERPQLHYGRSVRTGNQPGRPLFMFPSFPIAHQIHARRPCNGCNPIRP